MNKITTTQANPSRGIDPVRIHDSIKTLLLFPPRHSETFRRARGQEGPRGIGSGCEIHSAREGRRHTNCINIKRAQGCCPWSPPQEGARGQSSSARRGLPSKGEARALHHQPVPALTLTMPCISCSRSTFDRWIRQVPLENDENRQRHKRPKNGEKIK